MSIKQKMKIWKVALLVEDVKVAEEFYVGILGMEIITRSPLGSVLLDAGGINLEIIPKKIFEGDERLGKPGFHHLSFKVDDMRGVTEELKARGVKFIKEPFEIRQGVTLAFFDGLNDVHLQLFNQKQ
jgi:catechol 2,3-dioxygenase-like lactoylglutathione lyase family enzyme